MTAAEGRTTRRQIDRRVPLLAAAAIVAVVAWLAGGALPLLGPAVIALLLGATIRVLGPLDPSMTAVAPALGARLLQVSIVLLGLSVNVADVLSVAWTSLPVMLGTLGVGLVGIWLMGRWLGVDAPLRGLLTVGTSICGASAIAALAPVVGAGSAEIAYAVSVVFLFNVSAVVAFPVIAHALNLSGDSFAVWAGTAINDTSSVLAAGFAFGSGTAAYAAVVKLSRTLMILPVTIGAAMLLPDGDKGLAARGRAAFRRALPWFIVAFLGGSLLNGVGLVPHDAARAAGNLAQLGTVLALATIGLGTDIRAFRRAGPRPLVLGLAGWCLVAVTSLALQAATGLLTRTP